MNKQLIFPQFISWTFGIAAMAIGIINSFWGNDPGYGIFIFVLAFVYFPPLSKVIRERLGFTFSFLAKLLLALFILWSALGVAELFDKIDLMMQDF